MASRQLLLVAKYAQAFSDDFDRNIDELVREFSTIDNKTEIENATEVVCIEQSKVIPLYSYKKPAPFIAPFSFYTVIN